MFTHILQKTWQVRRDSLRSMLVGRNMHGTRRAALRKIPREFLEAMKDMINKNSRNHWSIFGLLGYANSQTRELHNIFFYT